MAKKRGIISTVTFNSTAFHLPFILCRDSVAKARRKDVVTTDNKYKVIYGLLNLANSNDLE